MPKLTINGDRCRGCGLCVAACPKKLIVLSASRLNARGHHPAEMADQDACTSCACCALMCPDVAIRVEKEDRA